MSRIFISYRRQDAAGDAGRLADHLNRRFGPARVFLDIETIDPGTDFERALTSSLQDTAAVLVVIGPRWLSLTKPDGTRRLDDPNDYVRREIEAVLGKNIPVVPVLVQGAALPRKEDLPASLTGLVKRQVATLDHAEFHDDAERLCERLAKSIGADGSTGFKTARKWWPIAALAGALAIAFVVYQTMGGKPATPADSAVKTADPDATTSSVAPLLSEASEQRRRGQLVDALATLARARSQAPASDTVRQVQEDVAMQWVREVQVEAGKSLGDAIKPSLTVIDAALASATGVRKADLQAHSGLAAFLMWRDGNRQLDPAQWYRDALKIDAGNPYANAMLAHWMLFREDEAAVDEAARLFRTALQSGRAKDAVRDLQWAAFGRSDKPGLTRELVRLADAMRRDGERLTDRRTSTLWAPYYFALSPTRRTEREAVLDALPPDDQISTLRWAFDDYARNDESRRQTVRYYVALLNERAGRQAEAREQLSTLAKELADRPGLLQDAVRSALRERPPTAAPDSPSR